MTDSQPSLPRYRCTKIVRAAKIARIERSQPGDDVDIVNERELSEWHDRHGGAVLELNVDGQTIAQQVNLAYVRKHDPQVGGYYVQYDDGYESWSPAEAFEAGYVRMPEPPSQAEPV
jgi:hypothetical protein